MSDYFNSRLVFYFCCIISVFSACKAGSRSTIQKIINTQHAIMPADSINQKQKKGIDFYANGNQPVNWSIEIDFDKLVSFKSADGNDLSVLPAFGNKETNNGIESYNTYTDKGLLFINIYKEPCDGGPSTVSSNRKVEVTLQNKIYSGCGQYLYNNQLNDIWILESVNNETQQGSAFSKGLPKFELNLQQNKISGSDGCNKISAGIEIKGNRIRFDAFTDTKINCNNKVSAMFTNQISGQLVDYYIENNKLVLYLQDDSKLIFKRAVL